MGRKTVIVQALRSALFYLLFIGQTVVLAIIVGTIGFISLKRGRKPPAISMAIARYWGRSNLAFLHYVVGLRTEVTGMENIPPGGCIIAAKHQSDWDIFALLPHASDPAFIAKKELLDIPFLGWAMTSLDAISVDRSRGAEAIPAMTRDAQAAVDAGRQIVIYPEGTRKAPLASPDYRAGTARLYTALNVPVVPVALNSGLFWGRNSPVLWPGLAQARFLPAIPPGLPAEAFQARLVSSIEAETNRLALEAKRRGLARPLTPELRAKLDALEHAAG
jgi:1-acyl-sn-glycerol-3-phosphate acyltransferase